MAQTQPLPEDEKTAVCIRILKWVVDFFPGLLLNPTLTASLQKHCIKQSVDPNRAVELLQLLIAIDFSQQRAE